MGFKSNFRIKQEGFTLVEILFVLMITTMTLTLLAQGISSLKRLEKISENDEDILLFAYQIQKELRQASKIELTGDQVLNYTIGDNYYTISLNNNRLVKTDGFEILLFNIDEIHFKMDDLISVELVREDRRYIKVIGIKRLMYD